MSLPLFNIYRFNAKFGISMFCRQSRSLLQSSSRSLLNIIPTNYDSTLDTQANFDRHPSTTNSTTNLISILDPCDPCDPTKIQTQPISISISKCDSLGPSSSSSSSQNPTKLFSISKHNFSNSHTANSGKFKQLPTASTSSSRTQKSSKTKSKQKNIDLSINQFEQQLKQKHQAQPQTQTRTPKPVTLATPTSSMPKSESRRAPPPPPPPPSATAPPSPPSRSMSSAQHQRLIAHQQMLKEEEIDPLSLGGVFVIILGSLTFYWLYCTDQKKHSGIDLNLNLMSRFFSSKTLTDYLAEQETRPIKIIDDDIKLVYLLFNHCKNIMLKYLYFFSSSPANRNYYNSESLISKLFRLFSTPEKMLLPPISAQFNPRTLVIDLDTVCHSVWSRSEGHERTMRPYYHDFIQRMAMTGWEIVLFGSNHEEFDWIESPDFVKLDGKGFVQHYLWSNNAYYFNGHRCKDLSRFNRDINRCIVIDSDPRNVQLYPGNTILLEKWTGDNQGDDSLKRITEFLEYVNKADVYDTREILNEYRGKDIGEEFRKRYYAAIFQMNKQNKMMAEKKVMREEDDDDEDEEDDEIEEEGEEEQAQF